MGGFWGKASVEKLCHMLEMTMSSFNFVYISQIRGHLNHDAGQNTWTTSDEWNLNTYTLTHTASTKQHQ